MPAQISELAKNIRSNAAEEKRSIDDFDRLLKSLGLFESFSQINLSLGPSKIGLDHLNFFNLDEKKEADHRLKAAFKFCGLNENEPRHWRALINALVTACFPKKGRSKTRDEQGLLELLFDIHELQASHPTLTNAEAIAAKLLRSTRFRKKYPSITKISSLTKLVRKAQDQKHNPYAAYREEKTIAMSVMREQYLAAGNSQEGFERGVRPVLEIALTLGNQRAQEDALVDLLKERHLELNGSVCSWEAEQHYRKIAKEALEKRRGNEEIPNRGGEPSSSL
jgi:hypothetical protein